MSNTPSPDSPLPPELKRAMQAFKKRLKLTQLDAESNLGGGHLSGGKASGIVAISPPDQFPSEVWEELVKHGRLRAAGQGMYEMLRA